MAPVKEASCIWAREKAERPAARTRLAAAVLALHLAADLVVRSTVTLHDQPVLRCLCVHFPCRLKIKISSKYIHLLCCDVMSITVEFNVILCKARKYHTQRTPECYVVSL